MSDEKIVIVSVSDEAVRKLSLLIGENLPAHPFTTKGKLRVDAIRAGRKLGNLVEQRLGFKRKFFVRKLKGNYKVPVVLNRELSSDQVLQMLSEIVSDGKVSFSFFEKLFKVLGLSVVAILAVIGLAAVIGMVLPSATPHLNTASNTNSADIIDIDNDILPPPTRTEVVLGEGGKKLYVFDDPLCPFCKRLEPVLQSLAKKGYEIHIFPTPLHEGAEKMIEGIACAKDKVRAWKLAIEEEKASAGCRDAEGAAKEALAFFRQFGFNATPTLINEFGRVSVGYLPENDLIAFIEER